MRCVAGARRRRINQRMGGSDARLGVSAGENVEFFRRARRGAFAGKCVSAAGSELTVARRRRKESLPPLAMLQTRSAASRGPKPVGPALCWKGIQATGGHAARFPKLSSTAKSPRRAALLTIVGYPRANRSAPPNKVDARRCPGAACHAAGVLNAAGSTLRRTKSLGNAVHGLQPVRPPKVLLAPTKRPSPSTRRRRAVDAAHRATSRRPRATASRGSRTRGQPLANKIEPGQP